MGKQQQPKRRGGAARSQSQARFVAVAAAGYRLAGELACPAPDHIMRRIYRDQLETAIQALTYDERDFLRTYGGS